jgi:predicted small secreted protein
MWQGRSGITAALAACCVTLAGCATLGGLQQIVQAPRLSQAPDRQSEIRLVGPGAGLPLGGAAVRVWATVHNPNPFGITLTTVSADVMVEGSRAASGDFPLGLPLQPTGEAVVPLDLSISFADLPGLATTLRRAAAGEAVAYELHGTIGVEAGRLGQPTFGPMRLMAGELRALR